MAPSCTPSSEPARMIKTRRMSIMNGKGEVHITACVDEPAGMAELRVRDSGKGIEPENLGRVFDPFFSLKPVGEGTGLGLSIAFGIVGKHNGTLEVQSQLGQGACFTVRLPLAERHDAKRDKT